MPRPAFVATTLVWTAAAAALLDLSTLHRFHHADALIPVLSSLHAWTPFYWEQNRFGMPIALLATPATDPAANLLVQCGITAWLGLLAFPLATRYLLGGRPGREWAGPAAAAVFVLLAPANLQWLYFTCVNVFSTSLALGLLGLIAAERLTAGRLAAAAGCFAVATWTNAAVGVMLFPVVVGVAAARLAWPGQDAERRGLWRAGLAQAGLCVAAVVLSKFLERIPPPEYRTTWVVVPPPAAWPGLVVESVQTFVADVEPGLWAAGVGVVVAVGVAVAVARRDWRGLGSFAAVVLATVAYWALTAVLFKARWRYATPALVLAHAAAFALLARSLTLTPRRAAVAFGLAALAAVVAAPVAHGLPKSDAATEALTERYGADADAVRAAGCTHVAGDYWRVWPVVFEVNRRGGPTVWGVAFRAGPTASQWRSAPADRVRVAAFAGDPDAAEQLARFPFPLRLVERRGDLEVYAAR